MIIRKNQISYGFESVENGDRFEKKFFEISSRMNSFCEVRFSTISIQSKQMLVQAIMWESHAIINAIIREASMYLLTKYLNIVALYLKWEASMYLLIKSPSMNCEQPEIDVIY